MSTDEGHTQTDATDTVDTADSDDPVLGWRVAGVGMVLVGIPYVVSLPGLVDGVFSVVGLACLVWGWYQIYQSKRRQ
ncbi:hypothetical protein SAMN04487950_0231 [Halogranum rubrum]|uniref:Uncharacterized protein n=1 Tax=Halogranum rubrum TaxID=553466 RepID=A0A1I4B0V3_9EURY|nr:hypothetical protein [Halogranum rubrum]SFK62405.1 hypothetical protein SAMN04487950_0231 [Halogranum rubrum]